MVQMISESKRKIAALALAGAMAIGGAAGVATTIASPAQNQSGIVMEAEAAANLTKAEKNNATTVKDMIQYPTIYFGKGSSAEIKLKNGYIIYNDTYFDGNNVKRVNNTLARATFTKSGVNKVTVYARKSSSGPLYKQVVTLKEAQNSDFKFEPSFSSGYKYKAHKVKISCPKLGWYPSFKVKYTKASDGKSSGWVTYSKSENNKVITIDGIKQGSTLYFYVGNESPMPYHEFGDDADSYPYSD